MIEWVFHPGADDPVHLRGMPSVEDAVVESRAHVHDLARDELTVLDHRPVFYRAEREH